MAELIATLFSGQSAICCFQHPGLIDKAGFAGILVR